MKYHNQEIWSYHYDRPKSKLAYPDEYLVSFLAKFFKNAQKRLMVLDLGCGSGRHLELLSKYSCSFLGQDFALNILKGQGHPSVCGRAEALPFCENSFDLIIMWGTLHYLSKQAAAKAIPEILRIMKPKAHFICTIRSRKDTHLKDVLRKGDLKTAQAVLYSKKKTIKIFSQFSQVKYGYIMRIPLGDRKIIAHHVIEAVK